MTNKEGDVAKAYFKAALINYQQACIALADARSEHFTDKEYKKFEECVIAAARHKEYTFKHLCQQYIECKALLSSDELDENLRKEMDAVIPHA